MFAIEKGGTDDDRIAKEFAGWFKDYVGAYFLVIYITILHNRF